MACFVAFSQLRGDIKNEWEAKRREYGYAVSRDFEPGQP